MTRVQAIQRLIEHFEKELDTMVQGAKAAHEAATHEESQPEDKHDTFAIESSYLAAGQAARALEIKTFIDEYKSHLEKAGSKTPSNVRAEPGMLVKLKSSGRIFYTFFAKHGGGVQVTLGNESLTVTTPESPLGDSILDSKAGDEIEIDTRNGTREYKILEVI